MQLPPTVSDPIAHVNGYRQDPPQPWPTVTVAMPILNEARHIEACLDAVLRQTYPGELTEIIIADGLSTDGTRELLQRYLDGYRPEGCEQTDQRIILIDNPRRIVSTALNAAILRASGEIVVRIDGHTIIDPDYIFQCVRTLYRSGADGVGGPMRAIGIGYLSEAIALATSTPFAIGNSAYRTSRFFKERYAETTHMGAYRREKLIRVGLFNENLVRHQDYELDYRIRRSGGTIFLSPDMRSHYYVRASLRKLRRQYFQYGFWKGRFLRNNFTSLKWRHAVPPAFVFTVFALVVSALVGVPYAWAGLGLVSGAYVAFLVTAALATAWHGPERRYLPVLPVIFALLHISWGVGVWLGLLLPEALSPKNWQR